MTPASIGSRFQTNLCGGCQSPTERYAPVGTKIAGFRQDIMSTVDDACSPQQLCRQIDNSTCILSALDQLHSYYAYAGGAVTDSPL